jgi:O-antigen/teichoic acid export membrane protein
MKMRTQFAVQLVGGLANIILLVALTPLLINALGLERYGVLLLILSLTIYVGLGEFGIGSAVGQRISAAIDLSEREAVLSNGLSVSLAFGVVGGVVFAFLAVPGAGKVLGLDSATAAELTTAWPALFLLGLGTIVAGVPQSALFGLGRFVELNIISVLATASGLVAPALWAVLVQNNLSGLIFVIALSRFLPMGLALLWCRRSGLRPVLHRPDPRVAKGLIGYGGWMTLTGILHRLTNSLDRPIISGFLGAAVVPLFAVPEALLSRSTFVVGALMSAAFPRLASASDGVGRGVVEACYRSVCLLSPAYVAGVLLIPEFLAIWLGQEFAAKASTTAVLLALACWIDAVGYVPYVYMQAAAIIRREALVAAAFVIPTAIALVGATKLLGVEGAALVAVIRSAAYLWGRLRATGHFGFPAIDFWLHSAVVGLSGGVAVAAVAGGVRFMMGAAVLGASLALVILRRPPFLGDVIRAALARLTVLRSPV